jgi:hypothetical protein
MNHLRTGLSRLAWKLLQAHKRGYITWEDMMRGLGFTPPEPGTETDAPCEPADEDQHKGVKQEGNRD